MKVFTALFGTETNTFCPVPTALEDFDYFSNGEDGWFGPYFETFRTTAQDRGWDVQNGPGYFASPAGTVTGSAYETIKADLLKVIKAAMPMDALVFALHGAMYSDGYPDSEGDFLAAVRDLVGPDIPIGVELDPHVHLTETMVDAADIIVMFKEWPHTDMLERAKETMDFTIDMAEGRIKPHMAMYDPRMIACIETDKEPGRTLVDDITAMEGKDGVLSISIGHSFQYADFPDVGNKVLVVTDNKPEKGGQLAEQIGNRLFDMRNDLKMEFTSLKDALDIFANAKDFPILVGEGYDAMVAGSSGDSTYLLRGMIEHGISDVLFAHFWDPMAVDVALKAGEGMHMRMRIGGKSGELAGKPVDMDVKIVKAIKGLVIKDGDSTYDVGDVAVVRGHGINIILNARRERNPVPEYFEALDIDPWGGDYKILTVKGPAGPSLMEKAAQTLDLDGPGGSSADVTNFEYKNIGRPKWPFDEDPFK